MNTIITLAGFGGQGIIKASITLAQVAVRQGFNALQNQAYGPQSRGGISKGDVVISDGKIYDIEPDSSDILFALSQQSFDRYIHLLKKDAGVLIYDTGTVTLPRAYDTIRAAGIPATAAASKEFGNRAITGTIAVGYACALMKFIDRSCAESVISESVPQHAKTANLKAFAFGWDTARNSKFIF